MGDITDLLVQARCGDGAAINELFAELYPQLRRMAHSRLASGGRNAMLDTSALVHECYLKFADAGRLSANDRAHFLAYTATAMRSIIVDFARGRLRERRGGDAVHEPLDTGLIDGLPTGNEQIVAVHEALEDLGRRDPRLVQVVELRYFAGLSEQEIADALEVNERTVRRDWEKARLLLADALRR